jgi:hypothetical protein
MYYSIERDRSYAADQRSSVYKVRDIYPRGSLDLSSTQVYDRCFLLGLVKGIQLEWENKLSGKKLTLLREKVEKRTLQLLQRVTVLGFDFQLQTSPRLSTSKFHLLQSNLITFFDISTTHIFLIPDSKLLNLM